MCELDSYEFFLDADLKQYEGKWISIVDSEIVSSGKSAKTVFDETKKKYPGKLPFITKIRDNIAMVV